MKAADYQFLLKWHRANVSWLYAEYEESDFSNYASYLRNHFKTTAFLQESTDNFIVKRGYYNHVRKLVGERMRAQELQERIDAKVEEFHTQDKEAQKIVRDIKLGNKIPNYSGFSGKFRYLFDKLFN